MMGTQLLNFLKKDKGFTLVELLLYVAIFIFVFVVIVSFLVWIIQINAKAKANRETLSAASRAIETIVEEVRQAERIYFPTSRLNAHPGQLGLETTKNLPAGENIAFIDFYLDNQKIYLKREGLSPVAITPDSVIVTGLIFMVLKSTSNPDAPASVRIGLEARYNTPSARPQWQSRTAFLSTATTLRTQ